MKTKRVIASFDVEMEVDGTWAKEDIALQLETCTTSDTWHNAIVWDSLSDFVADLKVGNEV